MRILFVCRKSGCVKTAFLILKTVEDLRSINHYQYARSSTTYGSVTMTRYPNYKNGRIRFENSGNITIYTDVLMGRYG